MCSNLISDDDERLIEWKPCSPLSWPNASVVKAVVRAGCNLVPLGYYNPAQPDSAMKIEWQIQFVEAEQILLRSLGHIQVSHARVVMNLVNMN